MKKKPLISFELFDEDFNPFERQNKPIPIEKAVKSFQEKGLIGLLENVRKKPKKKKKEMPFL